MYVIELPLFVFVLNLPVLLYGRAFKRRPKETKAKKVSYLALFASLSTIITLGIYIFWFLNNGEDLSSKYSFAAMFLAVASFLILFLDALLMDLATDSKELYRRTINYNNVFVERSWVFYFHFGAILLSLVLAVISGFV